MYKTLKLVKKSVKVLHWTLVFRNQVGMAMTGFLYEESPQVQAIPHLSPTTLTQTRWWLFHIICSRSRQREKATKISLSRRCSLGSKPWGQDKKQANKQTTNKWNYRFHSLTHRVKHKTARPRLSDCLSPCPSKVTSNTT